MPKRSARDDENGVNPPHNKPLHEHPAVIKARAYKFHKANQSLEIYYDQYPMDRPLEPEKRPKGRGR